MRGIVSAQNLPRGVAVFVIIAAVSAVFGPILSHDFINYDDDTNIYENPLMNPPTASSLVQTWKAPYFHMYIPVTRTLWTALAWIDVSSGSGAAGRLSPI